MRILKKKWNSQISGFRSPFHETGYVRGTLFRNPGSKRLPESAVAAFVSLFNAYQ
jgi:hypothetical protein